MKRWLNLVEAAVAMRAVGGCWLVAAKAPPLAYAHGPVTTSGPQPQTIAAIVEAGPRVPARGFHMLTNVSQLISDNSRLPMWGGFSGCGPAFQRVQPAESRQRARLPVPQSTVNFCERHYPAIK